MNPIDIINEFYAPGSDAGELLIRHSEAVAAKALRLAETLSAVHPELKPDISFIEEAALLHDIGIFYTNVPSIGCHGTYSYVCHGYLGRMLMEDMGHHRHALVCERHVGAGVSADEISAYHLPLPARNMVPVTIEEQIVCYADKFFSKNRTPDTEALKLEEVVRKIESYGPAQAQRFKNWVALFEPERVVW